MMRPLAFLLTLFSASPLLAQSLAMNTESAVRAGSVAGPVLGEEPLMAPALVTRALPRSIQVVEIPVPLAFANRDAVGYVVEPDGTTPLLSRRTGTIRGEGDRPGRLGSVLLTFSVPKRARAGMLPVARVRFSVPGLTAIEVPVHVAVEPTQSIEITVADQLRGVRPGDRLTLAYRVMNLGNTPEALVIGAVLPPGWEVVSGGNAPISLAANGMEEHAITVSVPLGTATGSAVIRLIAQAGGRPVAVAEVRVEVLDQVRSNSVGPLLTTSAGYGAGPDLTDNFTVGATVEGYLSPDVRIVGRFTSVVAADERGGYALSRVGMYRTFPTLTLAGRQWAVTAGASSGQFTDLTGVSFSQQGVTASMARGQWQASVLAGRPESYSRSAPDSGAFAGMQLGWTNSRVGVVGTATHLSDHRGLTRQLDALSLAASMPGLLRGTLSAELAQRWSESAEGLGWSAGYQRQTARDNVNVRLVQAPGGSRAFARATSELSAAASRMLTGAFGLFGSYWDSRDDAAVSFTRLGSRGWNAGAQVRISDAVSASLTGRRSDFEAAGSAGAFGTVDQGILATLSGREGRWYGNLTATMGRTSRTTSVTGGGSLDEAGRSRGAYGAVGMALGGGIVELGGRYDRYDQYSGHLPETGEIGVRADRVPLFAAHGVRLLAGGSVRRNFYSGFSAPRTIITSDAAVELPGGFGIGVSAERNPFLAGSGGTGWFYAIRVDRRTSLPAVAHATTRGVVYVDQNGNGRRDGGEPGYGGAIVRRGMTSGVTDRAGGFELPGADQESATVDPLSLSRGWILGATTRAGSRYEIAVVAVAPVEVTLTIAGEALDRVVPADLGPAIVLARHESGKLWVARRDGPDRAVFDALPPGRYSLELDLADLKEPLEQLTRPVFEVAGNTADAPRVDVVLRPRPVVIRRLDQEQGGRP